MPLSAACRLLTLSLALLRAQVLSPVPPQSMGLSGSAGAALGPVAAGAPGALTQSLLPAPGGPALPGAGTAPALAQPASTPAPAQVHAEAAALRTAPAPAPDPWASARAVAANLARGRGVPPEGHAVFHENLARYLFNAYPDRTLAELAELPEGLRLSSLPEVPRWGEKLARDLAEPYSDAELEEHLGRLEGELAEAVAFLRSLEPRGGFTLTLMGGLPRGRLSARSDLDVILRTEDQDAFAKAMASPFGYLVKERFVILSPPPRNKRVRRALGPMLELGDGSRARPGGGWLGELYREARAAFDLSTPEREIPLERLERMMELKKLSKRALKFPPGSPARAEIEERMRLIAKSLEAS